jgi:hypothetical protein
MGEDRRFQPHEFRRGVQPQFLEKSFALPFVGAQRFGLAAAPVQRQHQLCRQTLAQRVFVDGTLKLGDRRCRSAAGQQRIEPGLNDGLAQFLQPHRGRPGPLSVCHIGECCPAPQRQRLVECIESSLRLRWQDRHPLCRKGLEAPGIESGGSQLEDVPVPPPDDRRRIAEDPAEDRDVALHGAEHRRRRVVAPQVLDQTLHTDDRAGTDREASDDGTLSWSTQRQQGAIAFGRERTEHP